MTQIAVEVYEESEVVEESAVDAAKAAELVSELGLEGQAGYCSPEKPRCPFREMTDEELTVWRLCLPSHVDVEQYTASPIPLRVLILFKEAKQRGFFEEFEVWHAKGQPSRDPLLVGIAVPDKERKWEKRYHAIARWGADMESWPVLRKGACLVRRGQLTVALQKIAGEVEADLRNLKAMSDEKLLEGGTNMPSYYGRL
jgi:hypothetical protein